MVSARFHPTFAHSFVYSNGKLADGPVTLTMETYQRCAAEPLGRLTDLTPARARSLTLADVEQVTKTLDGAPELTSAVQLLRDPKTRLLAHGYCQTEKRTDRNLRFILSADGVRHEFSEQDLARIAGSAARKLAAASTLCSSVRHRRRRPLRTLRARLASTA